jgi:threonine dehydratase
MSAASDPFHTPPVLADLRAAQARIAPHAVLTPVLRSDALDALADCQLHFKCESLQRAGAFKFRGACNAVFSLDDAAAARGVLTQSSGNHGAALALACRLRGVPATVVVPRGAARIKLAAIRDYGAHIVPCETAQSDRDRVTAGVQADSGASFVHPYNDARVIAGQGTATLELLAAVPGIDSVIAPVSGGGLLSGSAIAARGVDPGIRVFGAEPEGARDAHDSLAGGERITGRPTKTICDGLRAELGPLTFGILRQHGVSILLADEAEIIAAMRLLWDHLKLVVEPSAAVPLAVILRHRALFAGRRVGVILSGGNVDLDALPWLPIQVSDAATG